MISTHAKRVVKSIVGSTPANALYGLGLPGGDANENLKQLQAKSLKAPIQTAQELSRGIRLDMDIANARQFQASSPSGSLLHLKAAEKSSCRWTALHIALGSLDLSDVDFFGVVIKSQSHSSSTISRISLRSGNKNKFRDCFFGKHLVSTTAPGTHLDMLDLGQAKNLPLTSEWRDLIVFFSDRDIDLALTKIRFFTA